ncbi:META domain-containing protein [Pseudooceanicola sp. LIPI14-2-Ac024]|uniref:META domain-containing protein n=1 Tax=Pseudooceanicola sp. LIPI14-2-Ac024 TaxID=3344875 RepID=UPI0035CEC7DC
MKAFAAPFLIAAALATPALAEVRTVTVTAEQQDAVEIPDGAMLRIDLLDVSKADAPSETITTQAMRITTLPLTVPLPYESELIVDNMTYAVSARVMSGESVLARTTTSHTVLTRGAGEAVTVVLEASQPAGDGTPIDIEVTWTAFEIGGRMLIVDNPPTLTLMPDGTFSVFAGCNQVNGSAEVTETGFEVQQPMASTRKLCPEPQMKLEEMTVEALESTRGYVRNGDLLTFVNAAGVPVLRFSKAG